MNRFMVDLETLGTSPNAAIVAIGACEFDEHTIGREFYRIVDLASAVEAGGVVDASTILWWLKQSDVARAELQRKGEDIYDVLQSFRAWLLDLSPDGDLEIWGNGATFDNVILRSAYTRLKMSAPWSYRDDRCFRTVKALAPPVDTTGWEGVAHNALDDTRWQARYLQEVWRRAARTSLEYGTWSCCGRLDLRDDECCPVCGDKF